MIEHELQQGTPEWLEFRWAHLPASDAPAMLGYSSYKARNDLIKEYATGVRPEPSPYVQKLFDNGHRFEEMARPIIEEELGEELYPITGSLEVDSLKLSASFDGLTMDYDIAWEHKTLNKVLAKAKKIADVPKQYHVQMEQQLLVSGADRCLFTASNGEREGMVKLWYESDKAIREELLAGWEDFLTDVAEYQEPTERTDREWREAVQAYQKAKADLTLAQSMEKIAKDFLIDVSGKRQAFGSGLSLTEVTRSGSVDNRAIYRDYNINPDDYRGTSSIYWKVTLEK